MYIQIICLLLLTAFSVSSHSSDKAPLRILTWEGYVTEDDLNEVNNRLDQAKLPFEAVVIEPYAEGAEQMFDLIRAGKVDVAFLALFFIKMINQQTSKQLQAINVDSPRLTNYKDLLPSLKQLPMGMSYPTQANESSKPLYIPWGGGAYGFYINRHKVKAEDVPKSVKELWLPKWKNRYSLNQSQEFYNIGLALMSLGKSPFLFHELVLSSQRHEIIELMNRTGQLQNKLNALYANAGHFWSASPAFRDDLLIVSSWGPEVTRENKDGGNWQLIEFEEGHMVWLDTINFVKGVSGQKLKAAEIFANYFIGEEVQNRVSRELSMVAASTKVKKEAGEKDATTIFRENMFVPPYDDISYSIMNRMIGVATPLM